MRTDVVIARPSAVRQALEVFSDPWSFAVLQEAFFGVRRFDELQRNLDISRSVLTRRLRHLVEHGILERTRYQRRPDRYDYRLTARGRDMYPIFVALRTWGERWLELEQPAPPLVHISCNHLTAPRMVCDHCGEEIRAEDVRHAAHESAGRP